MSKTVISTSKAPQAIGPYSQAVRAGNFLFLSGQLPASPVDGSISGDIKTQTRQVLENMRAVLEEGGSSLQDVVKTTVFVADLQDFAAMNEVYRQYFERDAPARSCVQAAAIPKGALLEVEAIACLSGD
jgi:2-iminobutanoate/2-iminopropanoate deaminase